ncbi:hypothetical protein LBMAG53_34570 [Planctomycetota bacterium]|nr:hypothetical protein LBMAG53_34570 [Planctomycetota bacterium]
MNLRTMMLIAAIIMFGNYHFASESTIYKCDSLISESSKTAIAIRGYTQKGEWKDTHDLIIDYSSIVSINGFRDEKNPKVSITSKEMIIDNGLTENRIYWISFKINC